MMKRRLKNCDRILVTLAMRALTQFEVSPDFFTHNCRNESKPVEGIDTLLGIKALECGSQQ